MRFIKQLAIILTISFIAEMMEHLIPLPIAASMYGLVLMVICLVNHIIPLEKVEGAADFLVEIMPMLFIPSTVGIMTSAEALKQMLVPLLVICIPTTFLVMIVTGRAAQFILRKDGKSKKELSAGENKSAEVQAAQKDETVMDQKVMEVQKS